MRAIGRFLAELVGVLIAGVLGFFAMLILAAGAVLIWVKGCVSGLFLIIALVESLWWLHTHSHHAAVTALGYYGYATATFALIPVLFFLKDKLTGWPERRQQQIAMRRIGDCGWREMDCSRRLGRLHRWAFSGDRVHAPGVVNDRAPRT